MAGFYHRWPKDEDPTQLLAPENQVSTPWGSADHGPCDTCHGAGQAPYRCLSCLEAGPDPGCPACQGRVEFTGVCPTCEGDGRITRTARRGVSAFPTIEGLYRYLVENDADLSGDVIVEIEGVLADDCDLDADQGAVLVLPRAVGAVRDIDPEIIASVARRISESG